MNKYYLDNDSINEVEDKPYDYTNEEPLEEEDTELTYEDEDAHDYCD